MRLYPLVVLAAFALPGCDSSQDRTHPRATDAMGAKAFKGGLLAYKQERYAEAAELFDTARKNLDDRREVESAMSAGPGPAGAPSGPGQTASNAGAARSSPAPLLQTGKPPRWPTAKASRRTRWPIGPSASSSW